MATNKPHPVVGVFNSLQQAKRALEELQQAGFRKEQLGIASRDEALKEGIHHPGHPIALTDSATGIVAGGAVGGLLGAAIATVLVPGIGPIILAGALAGIGAGVIAGMKATGFLTAALELGIPEEEAHYYEDQLDAGRTIVTVTAGDQAQPARAILNRHGATEADLPSRPAAAVSP
jgi:hypothetical protein